MAEFTLKEEDITRAVINREMVYEVGDFIAMTFNKSETEYRFLCSMHFAEELQENDFSRMVLGQYDKYRRALPDKEIIILLRQAPEEVLHNEAMGNL